MLPLFSHCSILASAEELEENTTYTNADGVECIIPAIRSTAYLEDGLSSAASSSSNLAGEEAAAGDCARFLERCVWDDLVGASSVVMEAVK